MTFYKTNNKYRPFDATGSVSNLNSGNYLLNEDDNGLYLTEYETFKIPVLYGNTVKLSNRIINTFSMREKSLGLLLSGQKGSGKSLLSKNICNDSKLPVIIINACFAGPDFNKFISDIKQECIVLFDEFEKVYQDAKIQEQLLTILDGIFQQKKLFIFTCNEKNKIDKNMINRPGRIYYSIHYEKLNKDILIDYLDKNLKNKEFFDAFIEIYSLIDDFNFDMLQSMVEEANRYDESPLELMDIMNVKPTFNFRTQYKVEVFDIENKLVNTYKEYFLIKDDFYHYVIVKPRKKTSNEDEDEEQDEEVIITFSHIIERSLRYIMFKNDNYTIKLTKIQ